MTVKDNSTQSINTVILELQKQIEELKKRIEALEKKK